MAASGPSRGHARLRVGDQINRSTCSRYSRSGLSRRGERRVVASRPPSLSASRGLKCTLRPCPQRHRCCRAASFGPFASRTRLAFIHEIGPVGVCRRRRRLVSLTGAPKPNESFFFHPTSDRTRLPAEFKHITKRRKRN